MNNAVTFIEEHFTPGRTVVTSVLDDEGLVRDVSEYGTLERDAGRVTESVINFLVEVEAERYELTIMDGHTTIATSDLLVAS